MRMTIPTLNGPKFSSRGNNRPGFPPRTMGEDFDQESANSSEVDYSTGFDNSVVSASVQGGGSPVTGSGFDFPASGVANILKAITPGVLQAVGLGPKTVPYYAGGYYPPASGTMPKWLLPAAAAGVVLLLVMRKK